MSLANNDRNNRSLSGRIFSADQTRHVRFAAAIAEALRAEFGSTGSAVKTVVNLTAANERAVRNWFEGKNAPSGEFLVLLCRHSDLVLETVLLRAGRQKLVQTKTLIDTKEKLREMLALIGQLESSF